MAYITFTDGGGAVTFSNGLGSIAGGTAGRFRGWTPTQMPVGPAVTALGTGRRYQFAFRTDYGASFAIEEVPVTSLPDALRLQAHLLGGGTVAVYTTDAASRTYSSCCLAPDATVGIEMTDPALLLYTVRLSLINLGGTQMLCDYSTL